MKIRPVYDSRRADASSRFVALRGKVTDGHLYAQAAYDQGCRRFTVEERLPLPDDAEQRIVPDTRVALSQLSAAYFGLPSQELCVIGVTGTKGKTTVTHYLRQVLEHAGRKVGTIGTNGVRYLGRHEDTVNTTPESYELQRILRTMADAGVDTVCMEVSSGGMMMHRADDVAFDIAVFTNLGEDHIGPMEHPDFADYRACKARLFERSPVGIVNLDDPHAATMLRSPVTRTFGIRSEAADFQAEAVHREAGLATSFTVRGRRYRIPAPGEFTVYNALACIACGTELGIAPELLQEGLKRVHVDGRMETIDDLPGVHVVVDYAHNRLSMEQLLRTLRSYQPQRLIVVFGSVGGRSEARRKELGDVVAELADVAVLTSDNPDHEDPETILDDIEASFAGSSCTVYREADRAGAIDLAVGLSRPGDTLVFAGKGHEKEQLVRGVRRSHDEVGLVRAACQRAALLRES